MGCPGARSTIYRRLNMGNKNDARESKDRTFGVHSTALDKLFRGR